MNTWVILLLVAVVVWVFMSRKQEHVVKSEMTKEKFEDEIHPESARGKCLESCMLGETACNALCYHLSSTI